MAHPSSMVRTWMDGKFMVLKSGMLITTPLFVRVVKKRSTGISQLTEPIKILCFAFSSNRNLMVTVGYFSGRRWMEQR